MEPITSATLRAFLQRLGERLNEVINRAWNRCLGVWQGFDEQRARLPTPALPPSPRRLPVVYPIGSARLCASFPLALGAFLNVVLTCRSGGISMPFPSNSSLTVTICSLG
jgi:hypothetical protein